MKKRAVLCLLLPAAALPYILLMAMWILMKASRVMETVFHNNAFELIGVFLIYMLIALIGTVTFFVLSILKSWDSVSLAKIAAIIKLIQIPAYILIFVLGVLFAITIFTFIFSAIFMIVDVLSVCMSGLITIAAVISAAKEGKRPLKHSIWVILLQFVFCADVVAAVIFYKQIKKS